MKKFKFRGVATLLSLPGNRHSEDASLKNSTEVSSSGFPAVKSSKDASVAIAELSKQLGKGIEDVEINGEEDAISCPVYRLGVLSHREPLLIHNFAIRATKR